MVILKNIGERHYLDSMPITILANRVLRGIIAGGVITGDFTKADLEDFQNEGFARAVFGVSYPILSRSRDVISGGARYYKDEIDCFGTPMYLTNEWRERHRDRLTDWILNRVSLHGTPVHPDSCDNDSRWVYYNTNVKNGERVAGLSRDLEVEYLEYLYNFSRRLLGHLFIDGSFPSPIEVILCKELPEKTYTHTDEYVAERVNELIKEGKPTSPERIGEILRHTDRILGEFCHSPRPHINIYFNQFTSPSREEFFAEISATLAHEFMHYLIYEYRRLHGRRAGKKIEVEEALCDFFGLVYSLSRTEDHRAARSMKWARRFTAERSYYNWVKWFGSGWPYSCALYFYTVDGKTLVFSYDLDDYRQHGSIDKLIEVFRATPDLRRAYLTLRNM